MSTTNILDMNNRIDALEKNSGGGGTTDYLDLTNKPQINGVTLTGNMATSDFGLVNTFQGTIAEWNQLSTAEKKAYDHASIPDSLDGNVTFPASKVIMTGGENVEDALGGLIKIDTKTGSFTPTNTIPNYIAIEDEIFDDVSGYTIIAIFVASGAPASVLFGAVSDYNITDGTNHKKLYAAYASRQTTNTNYKVTIVRIKNDVIAS